MEALKKKCMNQRIIALVVLVIIGGILICATGFSAFRSLIPTKLTGDSDLSSLEGKYVTYEMAMPLDCYESIGTVNEDTGAEAIKQYAYIVYDQEGDFYFGIVRDKKYDDETYEMADAVWDYIVGDTDDLPEAVTIKGTVVEMDSEDIGYYEDVLVVYEYYGIDVSTAEYYYIEEGRVGTADLTEAWVMTIIGLALIVGGIIWVLWGLKSWDKNIKKYLAAHPEVSRTQLDLEIASGNVMNNKCTIIGKNYIFVLDSVIKISSLDKLCWGYYYEHSGRNRVTQMRLFFADGEKLFVNASESNTKEMLTYLYDQLHYVVVGYSKEWEQLYSKKREEFLNLRYYPGKQE